MTAGDERYLLPRDKGPERALVRDIVDSRRTVGTWFFGGALRRAARSSDARSPAIALRRNLIWFVLAFAVVVDSILICRKIKKLVTRALPEDRRRRWARSTSTRIMRAITFRRLRMPKPASRSATRSKTVAFAGFPAEAFTFYEGLEADNSKTYWTAHKDVYDTCVRGPMGDIAAEAGGRRARRAKALPPAPGCALLEGQVALQDPSGRVFRGGQRRRLLPARRRRGPVYGGRVLRAHAGADGSLPGRGHAPATGAEWRRSSGRSPATASPRAATGCGRDRAAAHPTTRVSSRRATRPSPPGAATPLARSWRDARLLRPRTHRLAAPAPARRLGGGQRGPLRGGVAGHSEASALGRPAARSAPAAGAAGRPPEA